MKNTSNKGRRLGLRAEARRYSVPEPEPRFVNPTEGRQKRPSSSRSNPAFDRDVAFFRRQGKLMQEAYDLATAERWWYRDQDGNKHYEQDGEEPGEEHMTVRVMLVDANENVVDESFGVPNNDFAIRVAAAEMALARMPGKGSRVATTTRSAHRPPGMREVDDPEYIIQGLYNDGTSGGGFAEHGYNDERKAIDEARKIATSNWFEADYVRVITRDGDLVWDSRAGNFTKRSRRR